MSNMPPASPTTMYPGPPPPYSYPSSTASSAPTLNGLMSPPESRRMSGDDKEPHSVKRSLPSIHEALAHSPPQFALHIPSSAMAQPPAPITTSILSTPSIPRSHPPDGSPHDRPMTSQAEAPFSHPLQTHHLQPVQSQQIPYSSADARRISLPAIMSQDPNLPNLHAIRTGQAMGPPPHQDPEIQRQHPSPRYEHTPISAASMNANFTHARYQSAYPYPPPPPLPVAVTQPPYQPPPQFSRSLHTSRSDGRDARRVYDGQQYKSYGAATAETHGTSVKRHLEYFDVDASLRDMAESSNRLAEFSRDYKQRARDLQRTGPVPGMLPSVSEVDEMMRHQQRIQDVLGRLREMVVGQEAALVNQHAQERPFKPTEEFEIEDPGLNPDEAKSNGTASSEKKRRGRAAPPGRCHSCNRAETPEWRRGPDGARTLCNACGLHYAKLTRRLGPRASIGASSSLRPRSTGAGSPRS